MSRTHAQAARVATAHRPPDGARGGVTRLHSEVLRLQELAGNRATTEAIAPSVQRAPDARGNVGGELQLAGESPIRIQAASWSATSGFKALHRGSEREPTIQPTRSSLGLLEIRREPDAGSDVLRNLAPTGGDIDDEAAVTATLKLERPSADGRLPATEMTLKGLQFVSHAVARGEKPQEVFSFAVDDLVFGRTQRQASHTRPVGILDVAGPRGERLASLPVLTWQAVASGEAPGANGKVVAADVELLFRALREGRRLDLTYRRRDGGEDTLVMALVTRVASTPDGPDVVEVSFRAERIGQGR